MSKNKRGGHASRFYCDIYTEPDYVEARRIENEFNKERRARRKAFQK
jgi:hypothetical protein